MAKRAHIVVIDPAMVAPELTSYNRMALASPLPLSYHLPALHGLESLYREDLAAISGLVIMGSASSVNDRWAWQGELEAWVRPLLERSVPTLGICYGHQMLAAMFGGAVGYIFPEQSKYLGLRQVSLQATAWSPAGAGLLAVSHNEHVVTVPDELQVFGSSPEIRADALSHRRLPIWSFQAHPEATPLFFTARVASPPLEPSRLAAAFAFGQQLVDGFLHYAAAYRA